MRFEIREFNGSQFGEAHEFSAGENIADFENYVEQFTDEPDDEPARPFTGIVAGRQWVDSNGKQYSAFAYKK